MTIKRHQPGARLSQAAEYGNLVFLAGIVADDGLLDVKGQTKQIVDKIDKLLAAAGSNKSKILSAQIWVADIRYYTDMNAIWDPWIDPANPPARACIESRLANPAFKVEIMCVAAK